MKRAMKLGLYGGVLLALAGGGQAGPAGWQFKVAPYLWALGVNGDLGIHAETVPVDVNFLDAVQDLDLGGMLALEASNGPWSVLADGTYLQLSDGTDGVHGGFGAEFKQWTVQGVGLYRLLDKGATRVDIGTGGRYIALDATLNTPLDTPDLNASKGWADPVVALRVRQQISEKFHGALYGDIGGFGAASDLTWQALALAAYACAERCDLLAGYRALGYDYENDNFRFDVIQSGLIFGLQFNL